MLQSVKVVVRMRKLHAGSWPRRMPYRIFTSWGEKGKRRNGEEEKPYLVLFLLFLFSPFRLFSIVA
jgi:hypothetical protein